MTEKNFQNKCKKMITNYFNGRVEKTDATKLTEDDVFVVWLSKVLQNNKGLFSTNVSDGMYYEITYNGDKDVFYLDVYKKWENKEIKNEV